MCSPSMGQANPSAQPRWSAYAGRGLSVVKHMGTRSWCVLLEPKWSSETCCDDWGLWGLRSCLGASRQLMPVKTGAMPVPSRVHFPFLAEPILCQAQTA